MKAMNAVPRRAATLAWKSEGAVLGNDVVDLRDPDSNPGSHPLRFDERVFSPAESGAIRQHGASASLRWWFWAAKEAAFKSARKCDAKVVFSPPRFEVELLGRDAGCVVHRPERGACQRFEVRLWHGDGVVHAVASRDALRMAQEAQLVHGFRRLRRDESGEVAANSDFGPSRAVRDFAREQLACALDRPKQALRIRKQGGIPALWLADRPLAADLSLSHHGEWVAFACWLDASEMPGAAKRPRFVEASQARRCAS